MVENGSLKPSSILIRLSRLMLNILSYVVDVKAKVEVGVPHGVHDLLSSVQGRGGGVFALGDGERAVAIF